MGAVLVDRIGDLDDPHRVDVFRHVRVKKDTFELRWRRDGTRDCQGSYEDVAVAHRAAEQLHSCLRQGLEPPIGKHARVERRVAQPEVVVSMAALTDMWLAQHGGKIRTRESHRANMDNYVLLELPCHDENSQPTGSTICLNTIAPRQLTRSHVSTWKNALSRKPNQKRPGTVLSSSTVKSALVTLQAMLSWAESEDHVQNVAKPITHDTYGKRKPGWFRDEAEFWRFIDHSADWSQAAFVCAIYLGARFGELAALRVSEIDFDNQRVLFIRNMDAKGREGTVKIPSSEDWVSLHSTAEKYLRDHIDRYKRRPEQTVFFGPRGGGRLHNSVLRTALRAGLEGAGLDPAITLHGTRHSTATWLRKAGVDLAVIQRVMRHADLRTTLIYVHVDDDERVDAINALRGSA